jgi:hypothetical protein
MIVVFDGGRHLGFEIARQEVVFEQEAVLERLAPAFDLALVWVVSVFDALGTQNFEAAIQPWRMRLVWWI